MLSAFDPESNAINILAPGTGNIRSTLPLPAVGARPLRRVTSGIEEVTTGQAQLVWIDGVTYALATSTDRLLWTRPTRALPGRSLPTGSALADPVAALDATGLALLDPDTGQVRQRFALPAGGSNTARVFRLGSGFVLADSATTVFG